MQRTIIKYAVPVVSMVVGSGFNYTSTKAVGKIAKTHFKNRGKVTEELWTLISRQHTYDLIYPAVILYIAKIDGVYNEREREFYKAVLSRMSFDEHDQKEFQNLIDNEDTLLEYIAEIDDSHASNVIFELLLGSIWIPRSCRKKGYNHN